jgi:hypothetical protein
VTLRKENTFDSDYRQTIFLPLAKERFGKAKGIVLGGF